jgi:hypothetical protein
MGTMRRVATVVSLVTILPLGPTPADGREPTCERSGWRVVPSANEGHSDNDLRGVTAISAHDAWAVGLYVHGVTGSNTPLTEHWDGEAWSIVPATPPALAGSLLAVDATSSADVWAVGSSITELQTSAAMAVHWDGEAWEVVDVPSPPGGEFVGTVLTDVVAIAPDDAWAVGYWSLVTDQPPSPLIEHWDGTAWEVVENPPLETWSELQGVSATGPDDIWAVGNTEVPVGPDLVERALIEHWDGTGWSVVRTPFVSRRHPFTLDGVDAGGEQDAWAVGNVTRGGSVVNLALHWDGERWRRVDTPDPSSEYQLLADVSIEAPNKAWAVGTRFSERRGEDATLVVRWDGDRWARKPSDSRPAGNALNDVATLRSYRLAVGSFWKNGGDGPQRTLILSRCHA